MNSFLLGGMLVGTRIRRLACTLKFIHAPGIERVALSAQLKWLRTGEKFKFLQKIRLRSIERYQSEDTV